VLRCYGCVLSRCICPSVRRHPQGTIFNKQELQKMVELHLHDKRAEINENDANLLKGALKFSEGTVGNIMTERFLKNRIRAECTPAAVARLTPHACRDYAALSLRLCVRACLLVSRAAGKHESGVFMLDVNGKLDFDTMLEMHKRGHTRVPVCDGDPNNPQTPIVGLMLTKDLMLVDPEDEVPITALLQFCGRDILAVPENLTLDKMLDIFKASHTHLFFVQPPSIFADGALAEEKLAEIDERERGLTFKRSVSIEMDRRKGSAMQGTQDALRNVSGIITMEDVLEELIQAEIMDETDIYEDNRMVNKVQRGVREISEMEEREAFFRAMVGSKGYKEKTLSEEETNAVVSFLCLHVEPFMAVTDLAVVGGRICDGDSGTVSLARVREMLAVCRVEELDVDGEPAT
jgi:Mg2+/Co2+ transporter CorC